MSNLLDTIYQRPNNSDDTPVYGLLTLLVVPLAACCLGAWWFMSRKKEVPLVEEVVEEVAYPAAYQSYPTVQPMYTAYEAPKATYPLTGAYPAYPTLSAPTYVPAI